MDRLRATFRSDRAHAPSKLSRPCLRRKPPRRSDNQRQRPSRISVASQSYSGRDESRSPASESELSRDRFLLGVYRAALDETDRYRVDAVPLVRRGEALALEDMPQVAAALVAHDLDPAHPKTAVHLRLNRTRVALVKSWPAAS
eukprot:CAMPEP_0183366608 /NCGR_PEP_ID=MMETSP0164_2-20130417/89347_1 /TAXON_ID=221442 /ORGANISM="Coccolithus pelagicus ssp braarudi, Strain PLY182g" /LENGTH=143 /DNA_ID=CAMNT_0025542383 /DNA_START=326 /DNA_END=757 /DNA_ORIENTATION=-